MKKITSLSPMPRTPRLLKKLQVSTICQDPSQNFSYHFVRPRGTAATGKRFEQSSFCFLLVAGYTAGRAQSKFQVSTATGRLKVSGPKSAHEFTKFPAVSCQSAHPSREGRLLSARRAADRNSVSIGGRTRRGPGVVQISSLHGLGKVDS